MTQVNARSCGISVAALMATSARDFSAMSESIERGDTGRLFDHSLCLRFGFSDGNDFAR
jgi:hypothetical protein